MNDKFYILILISLYLIVYVILFKKNIYFGEYKIFLLNISNFKDFILSLEKMNFS